MNCLRFSPKNCSISYRFNRKNSTVNKYHREPAKTMIERANKLSENSFARYYASSYWYHRQVKSDKSKFEHSKYVINRF